MMTSLRALMHTGGGLICLLALPCFAQEEPDVSDLEPLPVMQPVMQDHQLRSSWNGIEDRIRLRPREERALELAATIHEAAEAPDPVASRGSVIFQFGSPPMPTVVCAPLRVCDIELEPGEIVREPPQAGGADEWYIHPMRSGAPVETTHIIVKPLRASVVTNLIVPTDRRTYHFELKATRKEHDSYMPRVAFTYPSEQRTRWQSYLQESRTREHANAANAQSTRSPEPNDDVRVDLSRFHASYEIRLRGRWWVRRHIKWAPTRVWDNGQKTIIEMPAAAAHQDLPILLVCEDHESDCNGDGDGRIVNFRVKGSRFVVDRIFRTAVLLRGIGRRQERVSIHRLPEG